MAGTSDAVDEVENVCTTCEGSGSCNDCAGSGVDDDDNNCQDCKGSGDCPDCDGSGNTD